MLNGRLILPACSLAALALGSGCSRNSEPVALPAPAAADDSFLDPTAWIDEVQMGEAVDAQGTITAARNEFAPGEPIYIAMSVVDAPTIATVSVHWYGPTNEPLAHESRYVMPAQRQLTFVHDNTADWRGGEYRAEIRVVGEKVSDKPFRIIASEAADGCRRKTEHVQDLDHSCRHNLSH